MSRAENLHRLITKELNPNFLEIINESNKHSVSPNSETHFKIIIVANQFTGLPQIARHRMIHHLLAEELASGLHALSLLLWTPTEWEKRKDSLPLSPACRGGYHHG